MRRIVSLSCSLAVASRSRRSRPTRQHGVDDQSTAQRRADRQPGAAAARGSLGRPPRHVTSNVLVADGRVIFVRADATGAPQLTALDAATGAHLWSVVTPAARIAYDGGRVFATQGSGIAAFSADTGARLWTRDLEADYGVPHVVADAGTVYALVAEPGSKVAAVRATDGGVLWTSPSLSSGDSAPTLDAQRLYVGFGGGQTYALSRATGEVLWHHDTGYSGGGGTTAVLHGGRLYAEAWTFKVLDPATGAMTGSYINHNGSDYSQPAFAGGLGIFRPATGLIAAGAGRRDAMVVRRRGAAPDHRGRARVHRGRRVRHRRPGGLVAIDLQSGAPVWCADLGIRPYPDGHAGPVSGGNGLIVVPVDDRLVAYGNGGTGSTCGGTSAPAPSRAGAVPRAALRPGPRSRSPVRRGSGPRITLRAARTKLVLGQRTRLTGVVSGRPARGRPAGPDRGRRSSVRSLPHARPRPHPRRRDLPGAARPRPQRPPARGARAAAASAPRALTVWTRTARARSAGSAQAGRGPASASPCSRRRARASGAGASSSISRRPPTRPGAASMPSAGRAAAA